MKIKTLIKVRYQETDQMGIVHHSVYPVWFEIGRTELIKKTGYSYSDIEAMGYYLPLVELNCKYYKPAIYDEDLILYTSIKKIQNRVLIFYYELYKNEILLVTGETKHLNTDKNFKMIKFNEKIFNELLKLQ